MKREAPESWEEVEMGPKGDQRRALASASGCHTLQASSPSLGWTASQPIYGSVPGLLVCRTTQAGEMSPLQSSCWSLSPYSWMVSVSQVEICWRS